MADAIVSFAVERLGDFLIQEAVFLGGVRNEMQLIKNELEWIVCFIKDAEEKQDDDPLVRKWVSDIRDIAYDIEDVLDKFLLKVDDGETPGQRVPGFLPSIRMCACIFSEGKEKVNLYRTGKKIEDLRKRISDLTRKRERYGLKNIDSKSEGTSNSLGRLKQLRRATSFAVEEEDVGFEDDADKLLAKLLEEEPRRFLISLFGMGGLGKTTLARKLYHSDDVKNKFDCCAWVSVSQDYQTEDLLLRIIKSFNIITSDHLERMREQDLERYLHKSLQGRSYLVVIDDVWKKEAWESLKRAFPDKKNGSRVIITTRIKEVAERSDERTHFHELRFLRPDESWQLLSEKAFRNTNADEELEKLGREMVQKSNGLPLAIVVLGGLLSTKKRQEWRIVRDNIWRHLRNDSIHISNLLALSFNDLSYQLKLCFLYLGLFPEDYEINIEKLIKLLVAEDLIAQDYDRILEDVAKHNLEQLINRSLIQLEKRCWGRIATCRLHDLLRDLAIQKARELNFLHIYDQIKNTTCSSSMSSCRRQAFYSRIEYSRLQQWNPLSRSLLLFNQRWDGNFRITEHLAPLCARFTFLRVLDIEAAEVTGTRLWRPNYLTEKMAKLIHLKYLGLRNSRIYKLPTSIINL
ncbi:Disease resistance protein [Melia azedarach]|uniref:Disease resistance protein n=1 Tax=Melia azedarach TaxID=155640 RepID=A0ACC1YLG4_MELAZ|nr:Disease resistance protein [Melia azedarach]